MPLQNTVPVGRQGTGPIGQRPIAGRGRGQGLRGRKAGARARGTSECVCPKCGHKEPHTRGIPCTETKCPKCQTPMRGTFCQ